MTGFYRSLLGAGLLVFFLSSQAYGAAFADLNCDNDVNVLDVQLSIVVALGVPLNETIDANLDGLPDACGEVSEGMACGEGTIVNDAGDACVVDPAKLDEAFANGVASVDITTDNAQSYDEGYTAGAATALTCQNGGTAICSCADGYTGSLCQSDVDDCLLGPCENGGICIDGFKSYTCVCAAGYAGPDCDDVITDCAGDPCANGGICTDGVNAYTCTCLDGFDGNNCEININDCAPDSCANGGACIDGIASFTCDCSGTGYEGETCLDEADACADDPCQNEAECVDCMASYRCLCPEGFGGVDCEVEESGAGAVSGEDYLFIGSHYDKLYAVDVNGGTCHLVNDQGSGSSMAGVAFSGTSPIQMYVADYVSQTGIRRFEIASSGAISHKGAWGQNLGNTADIGVMPDGSVVAQSHFGIQKQSAAGQNLETFKITYPGLGSVQSLLDTDTSGMALTPSGDVMFHYAACNASLEPVCGDGFCAGLSEYFSSVCGGFENPQFCEGGFDAMPNSFYCKADCPFGPNPPGLGLFGCPTGSMGVIARLNPNTGEMMNLVKTEELGLNDGIVVADDLNLYVISTYQEWGGGGSLYHMNLSTCGGEVTPLPLDGEHLAMDADGRLYTLDGGDVKRYDPQTGQVETVAPNCSEGARGMGILRTTIPIQF